MDPNERVYTNDRTDINEEVNFAYIKATNVPFKGDLIQSGMEADSKHIQLDFCDMQTYQLEEEELDQIKSKYKYDAVESLYQVIKAMHVCLEVSEFSISFRKKNENQNDD